MLFLFKCVASVFKWFSDWWNQFFLATIQTLKSGACGLRRAFFKDSEKVFCWAAGGVSACTKKKYTENISKELKKNSTKSGPCLEISCATILQPRIRSHLIWCIFHTACTLFAGTDLEYNPPPYLRKLTVQWRQVSCFAAGDYLKHVVLKYIEYCQKGDMKSQLVDQDDGSQMSPF